MIFHKSRISGISYLTFLCYKYTLYLETLCLQKISLKMIRLLSRLKSPYLAQPHEFMGDDVLLSVEKLEIM